MNVFRETSPKRLDLFYSVHLLAVYYQCYQRNKEALRHCKTTPTEGLHVKAWTLEFPPQMTDVFSLLSASLKTIALNVLSAKDKYILKRNFVDSWGPFGLLYHEIL